MENNLVELKFDRVNEYFEKFKKEYDAEYERNKTSGTRTIVPYHMLIRPAVASGMGLIVIFMALLLIASFLVNFVRMMAHSYETTIEYTKNEYYRKIKSRMLNKLRTELHDSITENMLIFAKNGLIIGPNLNSNENKKIFGEAERRLITSGKQFSRA